MYRFCCVPFGIISSPFLLPATIDHHFKNCNNDEGERIRENIYVDNVITGISHSGSSTSLQGFQADFQRGGNESTLGLYSPVTLRGKLLLQDLWNPRIAWDKHLTEQDKIQWFAIHKDLKLLANCYFTRHIGLDERRTTRYQLLVFCDASKYAYAAVVYLLQEDQDQQRVDLIFSKT